jgi:hypothetical protein
MQRQAHPIEIEGGQFEAAVEDLRLQAFRVYESVRATQRERDASLGDRTRGLSIAASLALQLVEDVRRIAWDTAIARQDDATRTAPDITTTTRRSNEFVRSAS